MCLMPPYLWLCRKQNRTPILAAFHRDRGRTALGYTKCEQGGWRFFRTNGEREGEDLHDGHVMEPGVEMW